MKKPSKIKKPIYGLAMGSLLMTGLSGSLPTTADAKTKITISSSKITLKAGKSKTLKLKGVSSRNVKKVKWESSKKKIATVSSKGVVKAKKAGKCTITAKYASKTYKCKVTVKKAVSDESTSEQKTSQETTTYEPRDNQMTTLYGPPPGYPGYDEWQNLYHDTTESPTSSIPDKQPVTTEKAAKDAPTTQTSEQITTGESSSEQPVPYMPSENENITVYGPPEVFQ